MERQELRLPASKEEIRAVYKTLKEKKPAGRIEIAEIHTAIPRFDQYLQGSRVNRRALLELDFLSRRLLQMTERDQEIFEAAAELEEKPSLTDLINLSYNLDCYTFYPDIFTVEEPEKSILRNENEGMPDECQGPRKWGGELSHRTAAGCAAKHGYVVKNETAIIPLYDGKNFPDLQAMLPDFTDKRETMRFSAL